MKQCTPPSKSELVVNQTWRGRGRCWNGARIFCPTVQVGGDPGISEAQRLASTTKHKQKVRENGQSSSPLSAQLASTTNNKQMNFSSVQKLGKYESSSASPASQTGRHKIF
ncbi:hypothetical protein PoB_005969500 [Plakobranchus ocellatus]|uniref:Uncharacterized protein n=1 Tax=Plakobranchus ocellatus TaxID=259542 RepID=A0AAV4CJX0_9GAST|nr:hypothetical protein PoB_005969500 [Plakobranchus ocellatus]